MCAWRIKLQIPSIRGGFFFYRRSIIRSLPSLNAFGSTVLLRVPFFPHLEHTFTKFLGGLDQPLDLDLPLEDLHLFLSWKYPLANNTYVLYPLMLFCLISPDNKDDTTLSKLEEFVLLPVDTTRLSDESVEEHNKQIHLSLLEILISTNNSWLTTILEVFVFSITKSPSFILRLYNLFCKNDFLTREFD
jgi:hypothetical protein